MDKYKISYRSAETCRRRSRQVTAASVDEARQLALSESTEIFSVTLIPKELASEPQREYLRAFNHGEWNHPNLTKDEASRRIDVLLLVDALTDWSFRDSYPATEKQFQTYHYYGGRLEPEFRTKTQAELSRLIDHATVKCGGFAPNPPSPRQLSALRFFFTITVVSHLEAMTKNDVSLFMDCFYSENPTAKKVWNAWKKTTGVPEGTYLIDPMTICIDTYSSLGETQLSLQCLQTIGAT